MTGRPDFRRSFRAAVLGVALVAAGCTADVVALRPDPAATATAATGSGSATFAADAVDPPADPPAPAPAAAPTTPTFHVRGRIEADAITVSQSPKNKAVYGDFQNAVGFRRARLGAEGTAGDQVHWVSEFDFAGGMVAFKNVFVGVRNLPVVGEVRVGHFREPFSLEGQTSSTVFPLVERSPANVLDPSRNWGVAAFSHTADERLTVQAGVFRSGTGRDGNDIGDGNDLAVTARVTGLPWLDESGEAPRLLHVGGAASQRYPKDDTITFSSGPQSSLLQSNTDNPLSPLMLDLTIPATQYQLLNLQSALVLGPLSVQAEWTGSRVDQIGGPPVFLQGAYVMAGYFLTGEHRVYDRKYGTFDGVRVRAPFVCTDQPGGVGAGPGAWELVGRLGWVDFADATRLAGPGGVRVGTRLTNLAVGVTWYLTDHARVMLDYIHAVPTDPLVGSSTADAFTVRTAVFW